jgi:hypothetical protein
MLSIKNTTSSMLSSVSAQKASITACAGSTNDSTASSWVRLLAFSSEDSGLRHRVNSCEFVLLSHQNGQLGHACRACLLRRWQSKPALKQFKSAVYPNDPLQQHFNLFLQKHDWSSRPTLDLQLGIFLRPFLIVEPVQREWSIRGNEQAL